MSVFNELEMTVGHATDWAKGAVGGAVTVVDTAAAGLGPAVGAVVNAPGAVLAPVARGAGRAMALGLKKLKELKQS